MRVNDQNDHEEKSQYYNYATQFSLSVSALPMSINVNLTNIENKTRHEKKISKPNNKVKKKN